MQSRNFQLHVTDNFGITQKRIFKFEKCKMQSELINFLNLKGLDIQYIVVIGILKLQERFLHHLHYDYLIPIFF